MSYYFLYHKKGVPTWLAYLLILILTLGLTLVFGGKPNRIISRATKNLSPQNITISNITGESAAVFFTTPDSFVSNLEFAKTNEPPLIIFDNRDKTKQTARTTHYFVLAGLDRNTVYRFRIFLENQAVSQSYEFRTAAVTFPSLSNTPIFGKVLLKNLQPASEVFVRAKIGDAFGLYSALSKETGEWLISFPITFDKDGQELSISETTPLTLEFIYASKKKTVVKVKYIDAQPLKTVILGKNYDFTLPNSILGVTTNRNSGLIRFPENNTIVTSFTPTFRGRATANSLIKLTLEPAVADLLLSVDSNGEWKFTPKTPLLPGRYQLLIKDKSVSETATFTIGKSGEAVLGEATPSATTTLSPSPSLTITPQLSVKPSPTAPPTVTLKPTALTPTVIKDQIPELGLNNNLVILFASGLSLLGLFLVLY
jgi:hypothetical protein